MCLIAFFYYYKQREVKSICGVGSNGCFKERKSPIVLLEPGEVNMPNKCERLLGSAYCPLEVYGHNLKIRLTQRR